MESTTVDPKNKAAIGCSVITTERAKDKGIATRANGPKFSVEQGDETLAIAFGIEKYSINDLGELLVNGVKSNANMPKAQQDRFAEYRKRIEAMKNRQAKKYKEDDTIVI